MKINQVGQKAKEILLNTVEGEVFSLSEEVQKGKNVLLVFLRHLG
jgi:peroxiredoxin